MSFGKSNNKNNSTQNQQFSGVDNYSGVDNFTNTDNYAKNIAQQQTVDPTNPAWVDALAHTLGGGVSGLTGADPRSFIAGPDALQTTAAAEAGGLSGSPWNFDGALGLTRGVAAAAAPHTGGVQALPFIQQYVDPYQNDVINAADADLTHNEGLTHAADDLALAGSGAFGGSGAALTKAADNEALARTRASTLSGIRSQGFAQALGAAQQDAQRLQGAKDLNAQLAGAHMDRTLAAAHQMGDLSTQYDANQRANITTQAQLGDAMRQIAQQYAQSPIDFQNALNQLFASLPLNLFHGTDTKGTQDESGTDNKSGTDTQSGTDNQSGTSSGTSNGSSSGFSFGFNLGGKK